MTDPIFVERALRRWAEGTLVRVRVLAERQRLVARPLPSGGREDLPRGIFEPRNKRDAVDGLTVLGGERDPSQLRHLAIRDERGVGSEGGGALHMLAGQQG